MVSKELTLKAITRQKTGTKDSAKLRAVGNIPVAVYGHNQAPESIAVNLREFTDALHHGHRLFDVDIDGKIEKLLLKDVQYDYLGKNFIHADLIRVDLTEKVKVSLGLVLKGTAKGAVEGGLLEEHLGSIEIECLVTDIPESLEVSVRELAIGDSIHAKDIELADGVTLASDPDALIVACQPPIVEVEVEETVEEGDEPTSPEVITEKKTDDEDAKD
ncbi:MAG: 50S ribosomal protein L25 [Anaerohalosphaeraceae bacterium]|nr:50S ribosomal protein L25 [Anaerohalosphaeraceae bacterium]